MLEIKNCKNEIINLKFFLLDIIYLLFYKYKNEILMYFFLFIINQ